MTACAVLHRGCKGGITRWEAKKALLMSNNQDNGNPGIEQQPRFNLTLSVSLDNGKTWPHRAIVWPAHMGKTGYSDVRVTSSGLAAVHLDTAQASNCRDAVQKLCANMTVDACTACVLKPGNRAVLEKPQQVPNHPVRAEEKHPRGNFPVPLMLTAMIVRQL